MSATTAQPDDSTEPGATGRFRVGVLVGVLIAGAVVFDIATPLQYTGVLILIVAAPVAACALSMRGTVITALLVCLVATGLYTFHSPYPPLRTVLGLMMIFFLAGVSVYVCRTRLHAERQLRSSRAVVEITARAVLPPVPPQIGCLRVAASYDAAFRASRIGGDLYAVEETRYGIRLIIGDVRGKGLGTISSVAALTGSFREAAHHAADLRELARWMEASADRVAANSEPFDGTEWFTTALIAEIPHSGECISIINFGHLSPLLLRDGAVHELNVEEPRLPLGLGLPGLDAPGAGELRLPRRPGDVLLFFTDGLLEARDEAGGFFDPVPLLQANHAQPIDVLIARLRTEAIGYAGGKLTDDMALLAVG
jgi:serine phosphatase RsbU (regulator of sigma subunit)